MSRAAPSGSEIATSGSSSMPAAISRDPPPMSSMSTRPEDQPNQRRQARKVSRASSSPGSTLIATPVPVPDRGQHLVAVGGVPYRRGGEGEQFLHALVLGDLQRLVDERPQLPGDAGRQPVPVLQVIAEVQLRLVGEHRQRPPALMGVNHQEMHRIGADVQDT